MRIVRTITEMQQAAREAARTGSVGLVPTMGALHEGHLSLVRRARAENHAVAATIFVNPLQFGANEDLDKYPRTFEADCTLLEQEGVDLLFAPTAEEMYPAGATTLVDPGAIATRLDGASRPGHFVGVATVVAKLFHAATPDRAYFGQKDAAQLAVIRHMVRDMNFPLEVIGCPIVRDRDGLALSSRNRYLNAEQRETALALPRILGILRKAIETGERRSKALLHQGQRLLADAQGLQPDYLVAVDAETLLPVSEAIPGTLIAIAASVGSTSKSVASTRESDKATRLIDNFILS